jgi:hypothetical protein
MSFYPRARAWIPAPIDMIKPFIENFSKPREITPTKETERRQAA